MLRTPGTAPWQLGPVSAFARITVAALIVLAVDSVLLWPTAPHAAVSGLYFGVPILLAIRVGRGFPHALVRAAGALAVATVLAARALAGSHAHPASTSAAIVVAGAVSATGLLAAVAGWLEQRRNGRRPDVVGQFVHETHDFLRGTAADR